MSNFYFKINNYVDLPCRLIKKTSLFILFLLIVGNFESFSQVNFSFNENEEYQIIDGFGASDAWRCQFVGKNWPTDKKERIAELLFSKAVDVDGNPKGIGLSIWRFYIGAGTAEQGVNSGIVNEWRRAESFIDNNGNYDWSKQKGQQWFLEEAKKAGVEKFLAFSIAPPVFWSKSYTGYNKSNDEILNLKTEHYSDYADFMVTVLKHFKQKGFPFDYLSPINEPQWNWEKTTQEGTPASNENIYALVNLINTQIDNKNLETKILISEAADLRYLYSDFKKNNRASQIGEFFGNRSSINISDIKNVERTITGHSYFTTWPVDSLISIRKKLNTSLVNNNVNYWQSEFCILENSDDIGGGGKRDLGINTALYVARVIHADLTLANAKSWQWWTAISNADFKDGLIYIDTGRKEDLYNLESLKYDGEFHDSKLLWAIGNYSRFIKPGMVRIKSEINSNESLVKQYEDLIVSGYKSNENNELVFVFINYSENAKTIKVNKKFANINFAYETSINQNLGYKIINNNQIELVPRSITTIIGKYNRR